MNTVKSLLTGKFSLVSTFWFVSVPTMTLLGLAGRLGELQPGSIAAIGYVAICVTSMAFLSISVWNAAGNYSGPALWKWLARIQSAFALAVVGGFAVTLSTSSIGERKYYLYADKGKYPACTNTYQEQSDGYLQFQVRTDQNQVIQRTFFAEDKSTKILELKDCVIFNEANWTCGGKRVDYPELGAECHSIDPKAEMINGILKMTMFARQSCPSIVRGIELGNIAYCPPKILSR